MKIGGGPPGSRSVDPQTSAQKPASANTHPTTRAGGDRFEKGGMRSEASGRNPSVLARESSGSTDVLRLARDNPAAARKLVATMAQQASDAMAGMARELAGARMVLEQLAAQKFAKKAHQKKSRELRKKRDELKALKMRLQIGSRKMALLQQLAGRLGDPRLDERIDWLLSNHRKLKTRWGRRHHLISVAENFFGEDNETPEHLREVVRAEIRAAGRGEAVGDVLHEISPRRVITELIARTLDGTTREMADEVREALQGDFGKSLQSWASLRDVMIDALAQDPFDEDV